MMEIRDDGKIYYDLMYLIACALNGKSAKLDHIDIDRIREEAQKDSILPLIGTVVPQFKDFFLENLYRNINFDNCKNRINRFFDENGIWHCSLKGIVTKELFPNSAMRFLADCDILVDENRKDDLRKYYKEENIRVLYLRESRRGEKEDSILINEQFHFELHYCLFNDGYRNEPWYQYFSNKELFNRLIKISDFEYRMTYEDYYLYFLVHMYKHSFDICDIRGLIDCYVINSKLLYDREYVENKLAEFGLVEYEKNIRIIGKKLISFDELTDEEEQYFFQCATNHTFGYLELNELRRIANGGDITKEVRMIAIKNIFFTPPERYSIQHPIIYRFFVFRPFFHFAHIVKRFIKWRETKLLIDKYKHLE